MLDLTDRAKGKISDIKNVANNVTSTEPRVKFKNGKIILAMHNLEITLFIKNLDLSDTPAENGGSSSKVTPPIDNKVQGSFKS